MKANNVEFYGEGEERVSTATIPIADARALAARLEAEGYEASYAPDTEDPAVAWVYAYRPEYGEGS